MEPSLYPPQTSAAPMTGNLALAAVAGFAAALVGAVAWAAIASAVNLKIGIAAVGVGYLVGLAVRSAGKGHSPIFGYLGAVLALLGCVLGDVLADCAIVAKHYEKPVMDVVTALTPQIALELLKEFFGVLDLLFYVLAAMAGYRNAFIKSRG